MLLIVALKAFFITRSLFSLLTDLKALNPIPIWKVKETYFCKIPINSFVKICLAEDFC